MRKILVSLGSATMIACAGKTIDVGPGPALSSDPGQMEAGSGPTEGFSIVAPPPSWPDPDSCIATSNAAITGTWKGYVESALAPWDKLVLVIQGAAEGGPVCGTLTIGSGDRPPPATDPNVGYPPGVLLSVSAILPGFTYTLLNGTLREGRLRIGISAAEPWRGWCALQTPITDDANPGLYRCVRNWPAAGCLQTNPATGEQVSVDCGKLALCMGMTCVCDANSCGANAAASDLFDLHVAGAEGDGSRETGQRVRFFRDE
jgi:hypothetical protein